MALTGFLTIGSAFAQVPKNLPGAVEPGRDRPLPTPPLPGTFDFSIETPRRSPVPRAVDELRFQLKDINIVGATVSTSPSSLSGECSSALPRASIMNTQSCASKMARGSPCRFS